MVDKEDDKDINPEESSSDMESEGEILPPSTIRSTAEFDKKGFDLERLLDEVTLREERKEDQEAISARKEGDRARKKGHILYKRYENELLFTDGDSEEIKVRTRDCKVITVNLADQEPVKDISPILRECSKAERSISSQLELQDKIEEEKNPLLITTSQRNFYITRRKLMGEILVVQKKLDRLRQTCASLDKIHALERFIRKLCLIKVLSDKLI